MTTPAQDHEQDMAAMRRAEFLGVDEDFRLTLAADGTYGLIAYRDPYSGAVCTYGVSVENCAYSVTFAATETTAESPEGIVRAFARDRCAFGRAVIVVRGVDEPYEFVI
jgi:hypothetical protein